MNAAIDDILDVLSTIQVHEGLGEWDGIPEVSAHISYFSEVGVNYRRLRDGIADHGFFKAKEAVCAS